MLEVRYNTDTKELTGWSGDPEQFGILNRGWDNEAIVILDIPIPDKPLEALLFDETTQTLVDNPDYVEPEPLFFDPENPAFGVEQRLSRVEAFLEALYPPGP